MSVKYPEIDPVAISLGPVAIHWYGLMYLFAFLIAWVIVSRRATHPGFPWNRDQLADLMFYVVLGVILGGRLGYMLFYSQGAWLEEPAILFKVWQGGMSFHGGVIGVMIAFAIYGWRHNRKYMEIGDLVTPLLPIGLFTGRIGNFINQELWGKTTDLPWGMVFPAAGPHPRHPTPLYEAMLEGVVLYIILYVYASMKPPLGAVSGLFLIGYAVFRIMVEFVRLPDAHIGYLAFGWLTMGQILCIPMLLGGIGIILWSYRRGF